MPTKIRARMNASQDVNGMMFLRATGLSLALATCIGWNLALWWNGRRKAGRA
mgnify:CR=1 FL=1